MRFLPIYPIIIVAISSCMNFSAIPILVIYAARIITQNMTKHTIKHFKTVSGFILSPLFCFFVFSVF